MDRNANDRREKLMLLRAKLNQVNKYIDLNNSNKNELLKTKIYYLRLIATV